MLKLAHRIVTDGVYSHANSILSGQQIIEKVSESTVILADNVRDYFVEHSGSDFDPTYNGYLLAPPDKLVFVEHSPIGGSTVANVGRVMREGYLLEWFDAKTFSENLPEKFHTVNLKWYCHAISIRHYQDNGESRVIPELGIMFGVNADCQIDWITLMSAGDSVPADRAAIYCNEMAIRSFVSVMAIMFMHCRNVVRRDVTETEGPSAKWLRRQKAPEIRYHVLDINPMKEVLRTEGGIEHNGLKKAMHICRGHFVRYSEERPLFGKHSGTFWKPAHVRGSAEHGIVDKDYELKLSSPDP